MSSARYRALAVTAVGALVLGTTGPARAMTAASDATAPEVLNRETVQAELTSQGALDVARLFSQLSVFGKGTVKVVDPVSTKGLRNLDGFSKPSVKDGAATYSIEVDGTASRRTVSDFTKTLPVTVNANYTFDGELVRPQDIVGKSGDLSVEYIVTNVTGTPTQLSWQDGLGKTHTEDVSLPTPFVGQLTTTLPGSFSQLVAPRADAAADGRGGTLLAFTMVLFSPIGETVQTFGWSGRVEKAQIPAVTVQLLPVNPSKKPELKFGEDGFKDGAAQASALTEGAGQIDSNLLRLQSGASDLLSGLTQLAAGAVSLRDGLSRQIGPGAKALATGATEAKAGSSALSSGLSDLSDGAAELSAGAQEARTGSTALNAGLTSADAGAAELSAGIAQILAGVRALPTTITGDPGYQQLVGALASVQAGITNQLVPGLAALKSGVSQAKGGVQAIVEGANGGGADIAAQLAQLGADVVSAGADPTVLAGLNALGATLTAQSTALLEGLAQVMAGLGSTSDMTSSTIQGGLNLLQLGLDNPACNLADPTSASNPCGVKQVQGLVSAGIDQLVAGISAQLVAGLGQANTGAADLADGVSQLVTGGAQLGGGLGALVGGAGQLAGGASEAAAGAGELDTGLGKLVAGAGQLSEGVGAAAAGSGDLVDGLNKAKAGNTDIVSGAGRLREEGTRPLVTAGNETAEDAAKNFRTLEALGKLADDGSLPYGAPEGATGTAAYQLTLAAANHDARDNTRRALVALLLFGMVGAASVLLRQRMGRR